MSESINADWKRWMNESALTGWPAKFRRLIFLLHRVPYQSFQFLRHLFMNPVNDMVVYSTRGDKQFLFPVDSYFDKAISPISTLLKRKCSSLAA